MNLNQALLKLCLHIGGKELCLDQFLLANQAGYVSLYGLCLNLWGSVWGMSFIGMIAKTSQNKP